MNRYSWLVLVVVMASEALAEPRFPLTLEDEIALPDVVLDDEPVRIHTQGLLVTKKHFYVTGRLEKAPKRALLLRFVRDTPQQYELLDLTPPATKAGTLDHPGGFDSDGESLWIPVALSRPASPSFIMRVPLQPGKPLRDHRPAIAFRVDDHIGAIAWDPQRDLLYGANWDTKHIYAFKRNGHQVARVPRSALVRDNAKWQLAVQDWKGLAKEGPLAGILLAGGVDKSPDREKGASRAIVEWIDPHHRQTVARLRLPPPEGFKGTVTNEGLAVVGNRLYLLPADLGHDAKIYRYRIKYPHWAFLVPRRPPYLAGNLRIKIGSASPRTRLLWRNSTAQVGVQLPKQIDTRSSDGCTLICWECSPRQVKRMHLSRMTIRSRMSASWIDCSLRRNTVNTGRVTGWT